MAPTKAMKRAAASQLGQTAAKAAKVVDPDLASVISIVQEAPGLSRPCKSMLCAVIPSSFGAPADERHAFNIAAVSMVEEVIQEERARLQAIIDQERAGVVDVEMQHAAHERDVAAAEAQAASAAAAVEGKQKALDEAKQTKTFKLEGLTLAKNLQTQAEAALAAAKQEQDKFEAAFEGSFKILRNNELEASEAKRRCAEILEIVKGLPVEASLLTTFPRSSAKAPAARGEFDNMVMEQLEKHLSRQIADVSKKAENAARLHNEHSAQVAIAEAALADSENVERVAAEALAEVVPLSDATAADVITKTAAMAAFIAEYSGVTVKRDQAVAALKDFEEAKVASFTKLKDKVAKTQVSPALETPAARCPDPSEALAAPAAGIADEVSPALETPAERCPDPSEALAAPAAGIADEVSPALETPAEKCPDPSEALAAPAAGVAGEVFPGFKTLVAKCPEPSEALATPAGGIAGA